MKHVWVIDEDNYNLFEGYVIDEYKDYKDMYDSAVNVYKDENKSSNLGLYSLENIFENKLTALNIYEGIINIARKKIYREIDKLSRKNEILFEKLLNIHNL